MLSMNGFNNVQLTQRNAKQRDTTQHNASATALATLLLELLTFTRVRNPN